MPKDMDTRFATESIPRLIVSLSAPAIAAQLVNALYNMVDRMYISRMPEVGTTALTGVGLTFPIILLVSAFAALIGFGGAPLASIKMGEGKPDKAAELMGSCFSMLCIVAVLLTGLLLLVKDPLLVLFGASEATLPYASDYLSIYLIGTISVQIALGMNQFISAQGYAKTAMATVCLGAALNILLDPLFIFVFEMGVKGAALATILSQTVSAIWVLYFISSDKSVLRLQRSNLRINRKVALSVLALGMSPFIMQSTESLIQIAFNKSLSVYGGAQGDLYVGAMVIMSSIMQFFMMPLQGFAQGTQPIISYNYGARSYRRVKLAIRYMTAFCGGMALFMWVICMFLPQYPIALFTSDPAVAELTAYTLRIFFFGSLVFGFQLSFQQVFIALGQAKVSIFIALLRKIVLLIPLIVILPRLMQPQTTAVFLAEPIADILAATTCIILFIIKYKQLLREPGQVEGAPHPT